jgi:hypothetical protein
MTCNRVERGGETWPRSRPSVEGIDAPRRPGPRAGGDSEQRPARGATALRALPADPVSRLVGVAQRRRLVALIVFWACRIGAPEPVAWIWVDR